MSANVRPAKLLFPLFALISLNVLSALSALVVLLAGANIVCAADIDKSAGFDAAEMKNTGTVDSLAAPAIKVGSTVPVVSLAGPVDILEDGDTMQRYTLSVSNYKAFSDSLFRQANYLKPMGEMLNSSRTWVYIKSADGTPLETFGTLSDNSQLKNLWFQIEKNSTPPAQVYVDIWDRQLDIHFKSAPVAVK